MKKQVILGFLIYLCCHTLLFAQQDHFTFKGYVKGLSTLQFFKNSKSFEDNTIHNRLDVDWYATQKLTVTFGMRNRFIFGNALKQIPDYKASLTQEQSYLNLKSVWMSNTSAIALTQLDRFYVDYVTGNLEISLGRQRINWGQAFVWNPNDLYNTYTYFDFDYEEKPGSDGLRLQYYLGNSGKLEWSTALDNNSKITSAMLYKFNTHGYDIQFFTGILRQNYFVLGTGWSGSIGGGGFNGEFTYLHHSKTNSISSNNVTAVLHYDYTFKNSLSLQFETLYNSFGNSTSENLISFTTTTLNPSNLFPTKIALFSSLSYQVSPLFTTMFSGIYGLDNQFIYFGPTLTYSIDDTKQLAVIGQFYRMKQKQITDINNGGAVFLRFKWAF